MFWKEGRELKGGGGAKRERKGAELGEGKKKEFCPVLFWRGGFLVRC